MAGFLQNMVGNVLKTPSKILGKKESFLKEDKGSTVGEIVSSQEAANELLQSILDRMDSIGGGDGPSGFDIGKDSGGKDSSGLGDMAQDKLVGKFMNNEKFTGFMSAAKSSMSSSSSSMKDIAKGAGGSGGMIALQVINKVLEAIRGTLSLINDTVEKGISQSVANQKQYLGPFSSRLQSFQDSSIDHYKNLSSNIRNIFTNSRFIDQQQLLKNIADLVNQGIGYNLEDRAYLATIADRTVATFEILNNSTLNRMVRLQQSDLTRAQMGLEAYLTQGLNSMFKDTSYLNSMYDSVTSALMEATSQMSFNETTGYLYNVQKWLGSLYSLGISENAINTIAQGLNFLGSGNVSQLTSNNQLNTLFAMSAQQAGLSYANLLTYGVSASDANKLLKSMVEYLQAIANNTSSEVLRSEYGRVFGGLSVSDFRAIQNLTPTDIGYIDAYTLSYEQAFEQTAEQIGKVKERTHLSTQIENMFNNLIYSIGAEIGEDEEAYRAWVYSSIADKLGDAIGGAIPGIIGDIFSNATGVVAEMVKTSQIAHAIRDLEMFQKYTWMEEFEDAQAYEDEMDAIGQEYLEEGDYVSYANWAAGGGSGLGKAARVTVNNLKADWKAIQTGVENWDEWSYKGFTDEFAFDNWQQLTSRGGQYTSSISIAENAFADAEAKIKAASEEITGVDDTISQSLDTLYDSLFSDAAKPIKVMIVDVDGNLLSTTTTNSFSSDFEVEQNAGQFIMNGASYVKNNIS